MPDETEFSWSDNDSVVIPPVAAIAVYTNPNGNVVIRQEGDPIGCQEDPFIVIRVRGASEQGTGLRCSLW